jgi:hypothetical protein
VLVNVRWVTDRRAFLVNSVGVLADNWIANTHRTFYRPKPRCPKRRAFWFFRCVLAIPLSACDNDSLATQPPSGRLPTLRCRCVLAIHCFRLAPLAENVTAQRSVTHLTLPSGSRLPILHFADTFWCSVPTGRVQAKMARL